LIFSCLVTPYRIAFVDIDSTKWLVINFFVDICFAIDILIIFNSAFFNDDYLLVDKRKIIAETYIRSWFFIDLLAIVPFDMFFQNSESGDMNKIIRITRIGRLYKLLKLMRLVRIIKMLK
jgi:hypothetical protein